MENHFIKPFDPHDENVQQNRNRWVERWNLLLKVKKITVAEEQICNFLYYEGDYVNDAYQPVKDETADDSLKKVIDKITNVFVPVVSMNVGIFRCILHMAF
jgi:hypothetical protein